MAWVPLDAIGQTYADWVLSHDELPALVNLVHPRPTAWHVVRRGVCDALGTSPPVVPLAAWVSKVEHAMHTASLRQMADIPAAKILNFFRDLLSASSTGQAPLGVEFCTAALQRSSPTMRELQPISEDHARMWVRFWRTSGYIL